MRYDPYTPCDECCSRDKEEVKDDNANDRRLEDPITKEKKRPESARFTGENGFKGIAYSFLINKIIASVASTALRSRR